MTLNGVCFCTTYAFHLSHMHADRCLVAPVNQTAASAMFTATDHRPIYALDTSAHHLWGYTQEFQKIMDIAVWTETAFQGEAVVTDLKVLSPSSRPDDERLWQPLQSCCTLSGKWQTLLMSYTGLSCRQCTSVHPESSMVNCSLCRARSR